MNYSLYPCLSACDSLAILPRAVQGPFRLGDASARHSKLNTRNVLAHKDLHVANTTYNEFNERITGILDWEFSGIVPIQR